jgi:S1-C subfamily serine protease
VINDQSLLLGGDTILAVDGTEVDGTPERSRIILDYLAKRPPGSTVKLRLLREGSQQEIVSYMPR